MTDPALISLVVMAWRQQDVVADAIRSAFAQTYQPLEIILSDDASPDGTFAVMQQMAAAYDGPHRIKLNRNPRNLGLIGHVNRVFELATGVLIVYNAGDDLSEPNRVARLSAAYSDGCPALLHSNVTDLDADGRPMKHQRDRHRHAQLAAMTLAEVATTKNNCIGASCAWDPRLMKVFGPITETDLFEDRVMYFRARLLGDVAYIEDRLVRYRRGMGLSFDRGEGEAETRRNFQIDLATMRQRLLDCQKVAPERDDVISALRRKIAKRQRQLAEFEGKAPDQNQARKARRRADREAKAQDQTL